MTEKELAEWHCRLKGIESILKDAQYFVNLTLHDLGYFIKKVDDDLIKIRPSDENKVE